MPGLNRTGPWGAGPKTGRGLGLCNPRSGGYATRLTWGFGRGRGFGRGFGPGMGWGRGYGRGSGWQRSGAPWGVGYTPAYGHGSDPLETRDEVEMLRTEADSLKNALDQINKRIEALERKSSE